MRSYFYTGTDKKLHRYHYCAGCGKQFTEDQFKNKDILNYGSDRNPMEYCNNGICNKRVFPKSKLPNYKIYHRGTEEDLVADEK